MDDERIYSKTVYLAFRENEIEICYPGFSGWFFRCFVFHLLGPSLYGFPSPGASTRPSVRITDRNGRLLYEILPQEGGRNAVLSVDKIPQCMKDATVAVEDKNFYTNPGVDLGGHPACVLDQPARWQDHCRGRRTITQQVARTLLLSQDERNERTLRRKLREAVLAWQMTRRFSKEEILALYLNQVNYGGMAYGVEAAAQEPILANPPLICCYRSAPCWLDCRRRPVSSIPSQIRIWPRRVKMWCWD